MNKASTYISSIALFMIFLIVTLPMYSANVFAATIFDVTATGSAGIPGFRAQTDTTKITVKVDSPDDAELGPEQVKIPQDKTKAFQCSLLEGTMFECFTEYAEYPVMDDIVSFSVQIYDDNKLPVTAPYAGTITVDSLPPSIQDMGDAIISRDLETGTVMGHYVVTDLACRSPACSGVCSGVQSIVFTVAGTPVGTVDSTNFTKGCKQEGSLQLSGLAVGGSVETKHLCIEATDNFGQASTSCRDVTIDSKAPQLTGLVVKDSTGTPITVTNGNAVSGITIEMNITEDSGLYTYPGSTTTGVVVDASELSEYPEHQTAFKNWPATCTQTTPTTYTCRATGLSLVITSQKSITIRVNGADRYQNVMNASQAVSLLFDNVGPVPTSIYSNWVDADGAYWVTEKGTTISMSVTEAGAGLNEKKMFIDFSNFGILFDAVTQSQASFGVIDDYSSIGMTQASSGLYYPTECLPGWTCNWINIGTSKQSGTTLQLRPAYGSQDDAGNLMTSEVVGDFYVDTEAPYTPDSSWEYADELAAQSNITGIGEGHDPMTNITGGDALDIHILVADHSGIKSARANLSEVLLEPADEVEATSCTLTDIANISGIKVYDCYWSTSAVLEGYLDNLAIQFSFEDFTNHTTAYELENIELLGKENETKTRWTMRLDEYSPAQGIDRMTWGLSGQRMYYRMTVERTGHAVPLYITLDPTSCVGIDWVGVDQETGEYIIRRVGLAEQVFNDMASTDSSAKEIAYIETNPAAVPEYYTTDELGNNVSVEFVNVSCSYYIQSIVTEGNEKTLSLPEQVNISYPIPVYNNPLGQNIGNINDFIEDEEDWVMNGWNKFAYYLRLILDFARQLCSLVQTLLTIINFFGFMGDLFGIASQTPVTKQECELANQFLKTSGEASDKGVDIINEIYYFCSMFITCKVSKAMKNDMLKNKDGTDKTCPPDEAYCKVQQWWTKYNRWWGEIGTLNFAEGAGTLGAEGAGTSGSTATTNKSATEIFDSDSFDPSKSFISSIMTGCLPGVVINLEKLRQLRCERLLCYKIQIPNGAPMWVCDEQYAKDVCLFWTGQVFAAIPILQWIQGVSRVIQQFVKNPLTFMFGMILDKLCTYGACYYANSCYSPPLCTACNLVTWGLTLVTVGLDLVENTASRFQQTWFDVCDEAVKESPSYENIAYPGSGKLKSLNEEEEEDTSASADASATPADTGATA